MPSGASRPMSTTSSNASPTSIANVRNGIDSKFVSTRSPSDRYCASM
jgi:hypothetical protein